MARTLDATLAASQGSQSRRPIVEIVSQQRDADIPFDGTLLTSLTSDEYAQNVLPHSTGRLLLLYVAESGAYNVLRLGYTDTARTVFTYVDFGSRTTGDQNIIACTLCELTGGNLGIVALVNDLTNHVYRLHRYIVTVTGAAVSNAEIANWSHDTFTSDPWVQTIGTDSYLLVYAKISGSDYYLYKRTSTDFATWAAEAQLSIGGLTSTWKIRNPSIIKLTSGDLWLWFDVLEATGAGGEELTNLYYSVSADGGGTWANAVKVTAYTGYGEVGSHPVAAQKAANQMHLIFTRKVGALHMGEAASGWPTGDCTSELSWDSVNRKLYAVNIHAHAGTKGLQCIVKIDVDTWTVDQYWDGTTTPGFPSFICGGMSAAYHVWVWNHLHDGHLIAITCWGERMIWLLDGEANTITSYYFDDRPALSVTANVTYSGSADYTSIHGTQVDAANNRIWVLMTDSYIWHPKVMVGYIDTTEATPEFHIVFSYTGITSDEAVSLDPTYGANGMLVDVAGGYIVLAGNSGGSWVGGCWVFDIDTGALIDSWTSSDSDFPRFGLLHATVYNGKIYAGMAKYTSGYSQSSFRGLAELDISSGTVVLYRPSYCSDDDHWFGRPFHLKDGLLAMTHHGYGVAVFDTIAKTWTLYNNASLPGMTVDGIDLKSEAQIAFDSTNEMIFVGDVGAWGAKDDNGVFMFSINGFIRQSTLRIGTDPGGGWSFAAAAPLVQGYLDYDAAAAVEPGSSTAMYVFWTREETDGEKSIKWDKDGSEIDLSAFLVAGTEVAFDRGIDGKPATLSFTVSNGHLFDPYNLMSLYNLYLRKGRKLTLRFGEEIGGTDYFENQGTFYVTGTTLSLQRGQYPVMEVEAEDGRAIWASAHIVATDIYNDLGEDILDDLMADVANLAPAEIDFPAMGGSSFEIQWLDTTLDEIVNQICNRLAHFFRFDMDGQASARPITNAGSLSHIYTGNADLVVYSPDDKYSDFTNRVTVIGQELDFTQLTFDEERIAQIAGTIGWWGCKADHVIWFSEDKSRRCINPRMNVLETASSIPFQLAGNVSETIEECGVGDDNKFCTVYVTAPNLIGMLAASLAIAVGGWAIGNYAPPTGGMTISVGRWVEKAGLVACVLILGSTANYQIEVWAQPLGQVRRSVQATWDDTEHQTEIGAIVPAVITDPLCYSAADCLEVATFEGMVAQMQRRRVTLTKVAHLQDEEGDTIRRAHPYSGQNIDLFITRIKRTLTVPEPGQGGGAFLDELECWVVS